MGTKANLIDAAPAGTGYRLDWMLRFPAEVERRFEAETGRSRSRQLQGSILLGLVFYNAFDVTSLYIMSDVLTTACLLRLAMTAIALGLVWLVPRLSALLREVLITVAMTGASAVPCYLFWLTEHPLKLMSFNDVTLTIVFGFMLLMLRFPAAILYGALCLAMSLAAIWTRGDLQDEAMIALTWQIVSACSFMLAGNWLLQKIQREAFLRTLREETRAEHLDAARLSLLELTRTDALTGLANRRWLDEILPLRFEAAAAGRQPLAVLMIDVDEFKHFNDNYGHPAGDACLRQVAAAIGAQSRGGTDLVARYGGEEFAVLVADADAGRVGQRLLAAVEALGIPHAFRADGRRSVTVSIGVAAFDPARTPSPAALLASADAALYAAKQNGRNACVVAGAPLVPLSLSA